MYNPINKGFTILELIVSIAIFAIMTALLLAKYGTFNQGVLLTNQAYDVALSIRNAQSYGLNVKSANRNADSFKRPYGVHFKEDSNQFIFFVDNDSDGVFNDKGPDQSLSVNTLKRGSTISSIVAQEDINGISKNVLVGDITFKRPDPNAILKVAYHPLLNLDDPGQYRNQFWIANAIVLTINSTDNSTRSITINSAGDISVNTFQ